MSSKRAQRPGERPAANQRTFVSPSLLFSPVCVSFPLSILCSLLAFLSLLSLPYFLFMYLAAFREREREKDRKTERKRERILACVGPSRGWPAHFTWIIPIRKIGYMRWLCARVLALGLAISSISTSAFAILDAPSIRLMYADAGSSMPG